MSYKKAVIYFMSGTGNTYRIAKTISEYANRRAVKSKVITIEDANFKKEINDNSNTLIGIAMPTHGFTAPWHMVRFAWRMPRKKETHAFVLATRASMKIGPKVWKGLSASSTFIISIILALKGYKVQGAIGIDMPSNWISVHPSFPMKTVEFIIGHSKEKAEEFIGKILMGEKQWKTGGNLYDLTCAILLFPISIMYLLVGRFFLAKLCFANNDCNSCGICADNCPVGAIEMKGKKNPWPYWKYNCETCMRCMAFCPKGAVEAGHSWGVALYYITTIPAAYYLLSNLGVSFAGVSDPNEYWLTQIIQFLYLYPSLFISYFLFYQLIRIPIINKLFTYTTLTHIYKRYNEPGTKLKDIASKN